MTSIIKNDQNKNKKKFSLLPIENLNLWKFYKYHESCRWSADEIDFSEDPHDWNILNEYEKKFISRVLAFFATGDGIVNENILQNLLSKAKSTEIEYFYVFQMAMENIHAETYSKIISILIKDENELNTLINAIETIPSIKRKADWMLNYIFNNKNYEESILAFICVEGIFFSSSFASIYWLKNKYPNKFKGLFVSNELIARDEAIHTDFGIELYNDSKFSKRLDEKYVHDLFKESIEIESLFVEDAISPSLVGIDSNDMKIYVRYVADQLLVSLNYSKLYNVYNPFDFMENISLRSKTNFFEKQDTNYSTPFKLNKEKLFNIEENF